jgi:aspartyl-tRNA(Asn)/glutamyl-tRNA(Gln) amidotransferase subunit B
VLSRENLRDKYEVIIGLEVHAQLKTRTKIFCSCPAEYGAEPNTNVCPVCLGLPGVLPVLNDQVVKLAIRTGLALGCSIAPRSRFARKHYFYPDLPKGYQITQYTEPLAFDGWLDVQVPGSKFQVSSSKRIRIRRCHIEEDAGKLIHAGASSLVDFNRCGVPLIEIVTDPDFRTAAEAEAYLYSLRQILQYLDVSDADMEKGHFRAELNLSVRPKGSTELFTQSEVKNLNSVRAVKGAIEYEAQRQIELHERGEPVRKETLLWDDKNEVTAPMRSKETAEDYRYFPEPDLPPLVITPDEVERIRAALPELPAQRKQRYMTQLGLSEYDASVITASPALSTYYEEILAANPKSQIPNSNQHPLDPKLAANWLTTEVVAKLHEQGVEITEFKVKSAEIAELLLLVKSDEITGKAAKEVFAEMAEKGGSPAAIVEAKGLGRIDDPELLVNNAAKVIANEYDLEGKYRAGKKNVLGALVGSAMKESRGRFLPQEVSKSLERELELTLPERMRQLGGEDLWRAWQWSAELPKKARIRAVTQEGKDIVIPIAQVRIVLRLPHCRYRIKGKGTMTVVEAKQAILKRDIVDDTVPDAVDLGDLE